MTQCQYPIILAPGVARFDALWSPLLQNIPRNWIRLENWCDRFNYFRNVASHLRAEGFTVDHAIVPFAGSVEDCGEALKQETLRVLNETGAAKVIILAHSKGGLGARHMIANLGMDGRVAGLATIGTPHYGSPLANFGLFHRGDRVIKVLRKFVDLSGFLNLTSGWARNFNLDIMEREAKNDVVYMAYTGTQNRDGVFFPLRESWDIVFDKEGQNDGLVSLTSQGWAKSLRFGTTEKMIHRGEFGFQLDHFNQCGWWDHAEKQKRANFEAAVLGVYSEIVGSLQKLMVT